MFFQWLKRYMPRGIYARAALILVLPVFTIQLVVSVVFVQRHFEGVSQQMTRGVARDIAYALKAPEAAAPLGLSMRIVDDAALPEADARRWYDFSGIVVAETLARQLQGVERVMLPNDNDVQLYLRQADETLYRVEFSRQRASASNPHQLLVNMLFFGVLMTVIAFFYLRNQLRPITRLAEAAEAFGRGRHVPYQPGGAVEVRAAGSAFLDMRNRIERQIFWMASSWPTTSFLRAFSNPGAALASRSAPS